MRGPVAPSAVCFAPMMRLQAWWGQPSDPIGGSNGVPVHMTTIAAPVFDDEGNVRYVLQCSGLEADVPSRKNDVAAPLLLAAERIGIMLRNAAA